MKRVLFPFFSCLLALTLLLGSFSSAGAEVGDDPVVTPVSGDMEFTTEVVPIAALPGTMELASQMLAPVGFPAGEAQFGGNGIRVKGLDSGKATVCFTLSTVAVNQGWGGKVGVWNGTNWVKLATTITPIEESNNSLACAPITGSGTYAFIMYVTDATLLPPPCTQDLEWFYMSMGNTGYYGVGFRFIGSTQPAAGQPFTWNITNQDPANFLTPTSGTGVITNKGIILAEILNLNSSIIFAPKFSYTVHIFTPECHMFVVDYDQSKFN